MARIDVVSSCLVGLESSAAPISRMELTPWDLQFLPLDPIQKGILLHKPESHLLRESLIDHLKNSFSRALAFFPPLAGRLATDENDDGTVCFFVDCSNAAGAEFTHATADAVSISDLLEPKYTPKIVYSLFPLNGVCNYEGTSKPLFGVQVTELADGLCIGCTANHAVVDGTSFWHFFNSWSELSRGFDSISKTPIFRPWFPPNDNRLIRLPPLEQQKQLQKFVPPPLLERVFHFSKECLAKLKARANGEAGTDNISSLQALSAHLWRSYHRCRNSSQSKTDPVSPEARFMMLVGARGRIPLAEGYFGNGAFVAQISTSESELLQNGLGFAARKIRELVAEQTRESVIKFVEDWMRNPALLRKGSLSLVIASSPRHNVYGNDFGWGKPLAVRSGKGQKFDGKITVFPAAVDGGIDAEVCFAAETLETMGDDAEFMEAFTI